MEAFLFLEMQLVPFGLQLPGVCCPLQGPPAFPSLMAAGEAEALKSLHLCYWGLSVTPGGGLVCHSGGLQEPPPQPVSPLLTQALGVTDPATCSPAPVRGLSCPGNPYPAQYPQGQLRPEVQLQGT